MSSVELVVYGDPVAQGSKIPVVNWKTRKVWLRDDNPHALAAWRKAIVDIATRGGRPALLDGPLAARIVFTVARPASQPKRRHPHTRPDLDKLLRAVLDALKVAEVIVDDARVVEFDRLAKVYPGRDLDSLDRPGARIYVRTLDPDQEGIPL